MTILQISDTHNRHRSLGELPMTDVLVHCGDISDNGTEVEVIDFLHWLIDLPHRHKLFVSGNHDFCLWDANGIDGLPDNVHFLQNKMCVIDDVRFFGLGFNQPTQLIPTAVDVLITHEPPLGILDEDRQGEHWGNESIRERVNAISPRLHLFGHAHNAYGVKLHNSTLFSNGAILNGNLQPIHQPRLFHLSANNLTYSIK